MVALSEFSGYPSTGETIIALVVLGIICVAVIIISWMINRSQRQWKSMPRRGFDAKGLIELQKEGKISLAEYMDIGRSIKKVAQKPVRRRPFNQPTTNASPAIPTVKRSSAPCPKCGYDCRATPDQCPECGAILRTR